MRACTNETSTQDRLLPSLPRLIFFDTNVVQNLYSFGELVYDNTLNPIIDSRITALSAQCREDIFALADFMMLGRRVGWPIAVSPRILDELDAIPGLGKRLALTDWAMELIRYFVSGVRESREATEGSRFSETGRFTEVQRCWLSDQLKVLPQGSDRRLIIDALEYGCDVFLTMDYKTIWRHRDCVNRFELRVMRPVELLEYIDPWTGSLR